MKKLFLAGAVAALMVPAAAFAQIAPQSTSETGATGSMESGPGAGDTMETGAGVGVDPSTTSSTSDTTGNYTIVTRTSSEVAASSSSSATTADTANRNTDPAAVQSTIDANPGLAESLAAEGIEMDDIGSISVEPNGQVVVFSKT